MTNDERNELIATLPDNVADSSLTINQKSVLAALWVWNGTDYAQGGNNPYRTNTALMADAGITSPQTLQNCIHKLTTLGLISRTAGKRGTASTYEVHTEAIQAFHSPTKNKENMSKTKNKKGHIQNTDNQVIKGDLLTKGDLLEIIENQSIRFDEELTQIKGHIEELKTVLGDLCNSLRDSEIKRSLKNVKIEGVTSDTDIETDTDKNTLKLNLPESHAPARVASVPESVDEFSFNNLKGVTPSGGDDVLEGGSDSHRLPDGITPSSDEDLSFNEFLVNGDDSPQAITDSVATKSVATETTPQSGDPKKIAPPDPPRGDVAPTPSTPKMPQDAQDLPMSAFVDSRGITAHSQQKNATQGKYGGRTSDLITNALEAIDAAKQTRKRVGKYRTLDECMEIVNSMDEAYKAMAAVVKQAQERARMSEVGYTGYLCINDVWNTERSGWSERQKNMIYRMAQDCDNLMLHHPYKTRLDRLHELIENLAHEPNHEKGENLIETILNHIDALTSIADGNPKREAKLNDLIMGDLDHAIKAHNRLTSMIDGYQVDEPTTSTTEEPATAYNTIEAVMQHAAKTQNNKEVNI